MTSVTELTEAKIPLADPTKTADSDKKARCVSRIKIVWAFTSFLISAADVLVIIWLSYLHFSHSSDLIAWLMLLPILLNFIGIFTFLSNENERREMEEHGCKRMKNLMFFPVIGPAVSTLRYFVYTLQEENAEKAERLESLIIKMKQYESFFRAAPEAFIQITFRIITWSSTQEYHAEDYWTSVCLALCLFTLAETNMYGCAMPYYRMFEYSPTHPWSIEHISIPWRIGLFFFAYFSIGSRIFADSIFKASFCFYFEAISFGEVIIICFITQFFLRASIYAFFNGLGPSSEKRKIKLAEQGVYGAFTYSWKSLFLSFDFQAYEKCIFLWFYIENVLMIGTSYTIVYAAQVNLDGRYLYHIYAVSAGVGMIIAISLRFALRNRWKRKHTNKVKHVSSVSDDSTKETV